MKVRENILLFLAITAGTGGLGLAKYKNKGCKKRLHDKVIRRTSTSTSTRGRKSEVRLESGQKV